MRKLIWGSIFFMMMAANADEYVAPRAELLKQGYQPLSRFHTQSKAEVNWPYAPHTIPWPVDFADSDHTLGNIMAQYQPFRDPAYYHGGLDIRTNTDFELRAPVSGWLEAGHYGYTSNPDGSMEKLWMPWPQRGSPTYFELALVTSDGIRFELHHVDRARLPAEIVQRLNRGREWVEAGTDLGHAVEFSATYDHIHYNIYLSNGVRINPEYAAPLVPDRVAPTILAAAAVMRSGRTVDLNAPLTERPEEIVVATIDKKDRGPYEHPPTVSRLVFTSGAETVWDFTQALLKTDGTFPPLPEFFKEGELTFPNGQTYSTEGGYGDGTSLVRLKVPAQASGDFRVELADAAGNQSQIAGSLRLP